MFITSFEEQNITYRSCSNLRIHLSIPDAPVKKIWTHQCGNPIKKYETYSLNSMANWLLKQCQWDNTSISQKLVSVNTKTGNICTENVRTHGTYYGCTSIKTRTVTVNDPPREEDRPEKSIPLDVVSQQVISNAEAGDTHAQAATTAAAADIVAEAEKDDAKARPIAAQAEANATTKPADAAEAEKANEAQGQSKPNEANPDAMDISLEFPVFCNWAPTVCEAAQVVISFPNTLTGWYTDTKTKAEEWATSITEAYHDFLKDDELPNDDTKVDITDIPTPELQENAISWGASCPADVSIPISMQGVSSTLVFSWSPWCQLLSIIKPAIVASAYIGAAFIVLGLRT